VTHVSDTSSRRPRVVAIIAAGGRGSRFGSTVPKQLLPLAGKAILEWSVAAFATHPLVDEVVVALPAALVVEPPTFLRALPRVRLVEGGDRRQDSVANGFAASPDGDLFVIHDAARPLVEAVTIGRTIDAALVSGAAIAAVRSHDTVKLSAPGASPPTIADTIDRKRVWLAQTPQAFSRRVLAEAIALGRAGTSVTDEAALAEQAGHKVQLVESNQRNLKITTPGDLVLAETWLRAETSKVRIGIGYDSHRLVEGRPLVLGGVRIPHAAGLAGHSDADALCHAITDAVLGAAALGDIGRHFPDTDPRYEGADSVELLRIAVGMIADAGWGVDNVDAVIVAERPKIAPHVEAIRASLAAALAVEVDAVSVKGKTNEGMGEAGRGEGIVVHAVATIRRTT
jgi:2-C-methyl-D-erythritol 4-phosphate cytidylyltransferase / 2-C-methyl-D-erythritol 2,4-cyclodiphosphate synthase